MIEDQELLITKSIHLENDVLDIAESIVHPMVDYSTQPKDKNFKDIVKKTWGQMAGSSVWLARYQLYFSVTRVYFYPNNDKNMASISFLYAQLFDADWKALENKTITWQGELLTFPRILDIPCDYKIGETWWGPEDPRVIIEQGVQDAEPTIIFNMLQLEGKVRSMYMHKPFSNFTVNFHIEGKKNTGTEKNWSPFYMPQNHSNPVDNYKYPSRHIHIVYDWHPLKILRCHLMNGDCQWAFAADQKGIAWSTYTDAHKYNDTKGALRGGSNFEPLNISPGAGLTSFVGFPRTHMDIGCEGKSLYRPSMAILTTNRTHFYLDYMSMALDFGHAVLSHEQYNDPCDEGRILLTNSIVRYDSRPEIDALTLSLTVADQSVQVAKVHGIANLVDNLPQFNLNRTAAWHNKAAQAFRLNVTHDVVVCSVLTSTDYALTFSGVDRESLSRIPPSTLHRHKHDPEENVEDAVPELGIEKSEHTDDLVKQPKKDTESKPKKHKKPHDNHLFARHEVMESNELY